METVVSTYEITRQCKSWFSFNLQYRHRKILKRGVFLVCQLILSLGNQDALNVKWSEQSFTEDKI